MTHCVRRIAALVSVAALIFAQLAVSAFACPHAMAPQAVQAADQPPADDCDGMANPNLCERHCDYGSSTVGHEAAAAPALAPAALSWRVDPPTLPDVSRVLIAKRNVSLPPPPLILLGVLRI